MGECYPGSYGSLTACASDDCARSTPRRSDSESPPGSVEGNESPRMLGEGAERQTPKGSRGRDGKSGGASKRFNRKGGTRTQKTRKIKSKSQQENGPSHSDKLKPAEVLKKYWTFMMQKCGFSSSSGRPRSRKKRGACRSLQFVALATAAATVLWHLSGSGSLDLGPTTPSLIDGR